MESALIEKEAFMLAPTERALIADHLLQTLGREDDGVMKAWADEADRRLALHLSGEMKALDGESFVRLLRKRLECATA